MELRKKVFQDPQFTSYAFDWRLQPQNLLEDLIDEAKSEDDYDDEDSLGCELADQVMQVGEYSFP